MNPGDVARWGQTDRPTDATAIFPPGGLVEYGRATIYYMDARGREVNVATPGGGISTTEYDRHDNATRELSASNRAKALLAADPEAESRKLDTQRVFSSDGRDLKSELGPQHGIRREDTGGLELARAYETIDYDEPPERPDGVERLHLPTTTTLGAKLTSGADSGGYVDQRKTKFSYLGDGGRGFTLRRPTSTTVDPGGLNLTTQTVYRADGLVAETRMPKADADGTDAHTTKTYYYESESSNIDDCRTDLAGGRPDWTGLPCQTRPAAQPTSGPPDIPITTYEYNRLYQVDKEIEKDRNGTLLRVTDPEYDDAGRLTSEQVSNAEGTTVPRSLTDYFSDTGRLKSTSLDESAARIERRYDRLGRIDRYQELDGTTVINTATTTYDLLDRPASVSDGKGSQTFIYDATTGDLTALDDSAINGSGGSDFTASYDVEGRIKQVDYPNGLRASTTYDETGTATQLGYTKVSGACGSTCAWLIFDNKESIHGQVLSETSSRMASASTRQYAYDRAGRLTEARETRPGQGCTTRSYGYDADSNRRSFISRPPAGDGSCVTAGGTPGTYTHDEADRLTGAGIAYDSLGRITTLPPAHAGGETELATDYYTNDLVRRQTQDDNVDGVINRVTNEYDLDPLRRQSRRVTTGARSGTEDYHYADDSDSPAWIASDGSTWTRNIGGIGGDLVAIQLSQGSVELQLTNLHGDIAATSSTDPNSSTLSEASKADEFGVPRESNPLKYGWLGGKDRRTELRSGVVQMGVRTYVPELGRFLQTDPVTGGSANTYDYADQDPINGLDLAGTRRIRKRDIRRAIRRVRQQHPRISGRGFANAVRRRLQRIQKKHIGMKYTEHAKAQSSNALCQNYNEQQEKSCAKLKKRLGGEYKVPGVVRGVCIGIALTAKFTGIFGISGGIVCAVNELAAWSSEE